jgi:hypothetical protein
VSPFVKAVAKRPTSSRPASVRMSVVFPRTHAHARG